MPDGIEVLFDLQFFFDPLPPALSDVVVPKKLVTWFVAPAEYNLTWSAEQFLPIRQGYILDRSVDLPINLPLFNQGLKPLILDIHILPAQAEQLSCPGS